MRKFGKILGAVVPLLIALGMQLVILVSIQSIFIACYIIKVYLNKADKGSLDIIEVVNNFTNTVSKSNDYSLFVTVIWALVCGILFYLWLRKINRASLIFNPKKLLTMKRICLFLLIGIGCQAFLGGAMSLIQPLFKDLFSEYMKLINSITGGNMFLVALYTVLIAPTVEELLFRGVILHKASKVIPFMGANILQAALFGIYHMNIIQGTYAFLLGLLLGIVCWKFRTIYASIFMHMCVNTSAFLFMKVPEGKLSYILMVAIGGTILAFSFITLINGTDQLKTKSEVHID